MRGARRLELKKEIESSIEIILEALDFNILSFKEKYRQTSNGRHELYSQSYWVGSPEYLGHLDFTYTIPKKPNNTPYYVISYHRFIAKTLDERNQLQSSGLLGCIKKLSPGTARVLYVKYFEAGDTDSGAIVIYFSVDKTNPTELANLARYIKQVDSLVADYMQTEKSLSLNSRVH